MDIQQQKKFKILLIGDSCLDVYHFGSCDRLSQEAPIPILKETHAKEVEGMAANVKNNLASFNIDVVFLTNKENIKKHRFIEKRSNYQMLRVDEGEDNIQPLQIKELPEDSYDALLISDYDKGFITHDVASFITQKYNNIPIFVDSKKKDLSCFKNSFIKINEKEYNDHQAVDLSSKLIVTLGSAGAMYEDIIYNTHNVDVHDVCGAGDVFLSSLSYKFLSCKDIIDSIKFANKMATISVTKLGTYVLTEEDINNNDLCY